MENLIHNKLCIDVKIDENMNLMRLIWSGESDDISPSKVLSPYLSKIAEEVGNRKIVIELYDLDFINSSTVPPIVQFIKQCSKMNLEILILYSNSKEWQRYSFKSFETFKIIYKNLQINAV